MVSAQLKNKAFVNLSEEYRVSVFAQDGDDDEDDDEVETLDDDL